MEQKKLFGTDGIRGRIHEGFFTPPQLTRFGQIFRDWAQAKKTSSLKIVFLYDTRASSEWIKTALANGLQHPEIALFDAGILPTPAASLLCKIDGFDYAIVISASHNPAEDNGIKIFTASGAKLSDGDEQALTTAFFNSKTEPAPATAAIIKSYEEGTDHYITALCKPFTQNFLVGMRVALDCANGSAYLTAPEIFKRFGAEVIALSATPDGRNINQDCGSLHPEQLQKTVRLEQAIIGFAFDGDGDRLITIAADGSLRDGDDTLFALAHHPNYESSIAVIGTILTNLGCERALEAEGKKLVRTQVGDRFIAQEVRQRGVPLGGEQSGHSILADSPAQGDATFAALRLLETLIERNNLTFRSFAKYPQIALTVQVSARPSLTEEPYVSLIKKAEKALISGRIIVRYSGTEPLLRIMVEAEDVARARDCATTLAKNLQNALSSKQPRGKAAHE